MKPAIDLNPQSLEQLEHMGELDDSDIDLLEASFAFGALWRKGITYERYFDTIEKMFKRLEEMNPQTIHEKIEALNKVIYDEFAFSGNHEDYDNLNNANLLTVIDMRKGLPISIGIIYIYLSRLMGWSIDGLNFPGHFIVRMEENGQRILLDPFNGGSVLGAADLRHFLKIIVGSTAELSSDFYDPLTNRDILIRLQNNIKVRLIRNEEYEKAAQVVDAMLLLAPDDHRLFFDAGVLYSKIGLLKQAVEYLERYRDRITSSYEIAEVNSIINEIKTLLS